MLYRTGVELETCLWMSPLKLDISQSPKKFKARKIMHKLVRYQITLLESDDPYCFAYIVAPLILYKNVFVLQTDLGILPFK